VAADRMRAVRLITIYLQGRHFSAWQRMSPSKTSKRSRRLLRTRKENFSQGRE
jgi:hypothetical protein